MENIELWIIGVLFPATLISLIALKESRHFAKYWKDLYFIQKDLNDKLKKASDGNPVDLKNGKLPIPRVSVSSLPKERCSKCATKLGSIKNDVQLCPHCGNYER